MNKKTMNKKSSKANLKRRALLDKEAMRQVRGRMAMLNSAAFIKQFRVLP